MTPEIDNLRRTVLTAPRGSLAILDAVDRLVDLGRCCVADEALDEREQVEAITNEKIHESLYRGQLETPTRR